MIEKIKKIAIMQWILLRYCYYFFYVKAKKIDNTDTWLISERGTDSRDNAYHLFRYIRENYPDCNIKYVIDNNSADYQKIKNLGNTVNFRSKEHFIYFLTAGKLISTHIMGFSPDMSLFSRLDNLNLLRIKGKRVFLQHGVTQNKVFSRTKVHLFLCSSQKEYNFLKNVCNVNKDVLKCIGMPRFDKLVSHANKSNKKILLMPTFRKWLNYVEDFKSTEYYKTYESLLSNKELIKILINSNTKLYFYPHYEIQKRIKDFYSKSKNIIIADFGHFEVQKLLVECDLLITDFSSVHFDFAYMKKPVIYFQFDKTRYFKEHYKKGFYDYYQDGFGKVSTNTKDLLSEINKIIENNFVIDHKYKKKATDFFAYNDNNNCKRAFKEISRL